MRSFPAKPTIGVGEPFPSDLQRSLAEKVVSRA